MDSSVLAKAVASELLSGSGIWIFLLLTALFAGIGSYFGKYFETKGANLATKEDFNSLQTQLSASTRVVESVKSEIARTDWVAREWATLRIKKIEELMTILHKCDVYLVEARDASMEGRYRSDAAPFDHAIVITELYLPELVPAINQYILKCRMIDLEINKLGQQTMTNNHEGKNSTGLWNNFIDRVGYEELVTISTANRTKVSQLLQQIVVDQKSNIS